MTQTLIFFMAGGITQSHSGGFNMTSLSNVTSPQPNHQAVNFDQLKSSTVIQQPHRIGDVRILFLLLLNRFTIFKIYLKPNFAGNQQPLCKKNVISL